MTTATDIIRGVLTAAAAVLITVGIGWAFTVVILQHSTHTNASNADAHTNICLAWKLDSATVLNTLVAASQDREGLNPDQAALDAYLDAH